ncbi:unnamed protein product [Schistosoma curassoni]|uniref:Uncharacterized protein n=1 Tax=Schistosoma curassoni TaxID=6186 RepID=A0A183JKB7_9TREM|nr:unnamed protein product [Schistosoma curassoni]
MKVNLKNQWTTGQTALYRFNTAFLRDTDELNHLKITVNDKFQALQDLLKEEGITMNDNWKVIKEALTSICQDVLGCKKQHHKERISIKTCARFKNKRKKDNN